MKSCIAKLIVFFPLMCLSITLMAQATDTSHAAVRFPEPSQFANSVITYKIIKSANHSFCYDIYADGKLLIHQPSKPGMAGNEGFNTGDKAIKMAEFVIGKIKNGEMPPTVTIQDMKQMSLLE
jgi:hypothetical protein